MSLTIHHSVMNAMLAILLLSILVRAEERNLIQGGTPVTANQYPFIVLFIIQKIDGETKICGGSLIRKEFPAVVLTAAHCLTDAVLQRSFVRLNSDDINGRNAGRNSRPIDSPITRQVTRNYNAKTNQNDIALLFLTQDISQFPEVDIIALNSHQFGQECCVPGEPLQLIGYGSDCPGCAVTPTLEVANLAYINRIDCWNSWPGKIDQTMSCASALNQFSCKGDSGGPLFRVIDGSYEQVGIVSWAP